METYDQLLDRIKRYWADTSRSPQETRADLSCLINEIEVLIDTLPTE